MDSVNERCAGLDVHKKTVVACVRVPDGSEALRQTRLPSIEDAPDGCGGTFLHIDPKLRSPPAPPAKGIRPVTARTPPEGPCVVQESPVGPSSTPCGCIAFTPGAVATRAIPDVRADGEAGCRH